MLFTFCSSKKDKTDLYYFTAAFDQKIKELELNNYKLHQFIIKDEKQDTLLIDSVEWKKELSLFFDNALSEKKAINYHRTEKSTKDIITIEYELIGNQEELKKLSCVSKEDGSFVYKVELVKKNRLSEISYQIEFDSNKGYLIKGSQNVPYSYKTGFRIEGYFVQ